MLAKTNICSFFTKGTVSNSQLLIMLWGILQIYRSLNYRHHKVLLKLFLVTSNIILDMPLHSSHHSLHSTGTLENKDCKSCSETHPCPRHSLCCIKGSRNRKGKGERFMTYDPHRCMICKAYIAQSKNGVAATKEALRKHFIAIRGHRQRSHCPSSELMNFFSSEEEAIQLLTLTQCTLPSPCTHSKVSNYVILLYLSYFNLHSSTEIYNNKYTV